MVSETTICALATAPGSAGVAIVRVSGPLAPSILCKLSGKSRRFFCHGHMRLCRLADDDGAIDHAYVVLFVAPRSFTGDDVAEVHCHGSPAVVARLLDAICQLGAQPAQRGEFSRRAFLAGKLDLAQAEAILDLVSARGEAGRQTALDHLDGRVSEAIATLRRPILEAMADVEARLDFSTAEDVGPVPEHYCDGVAATAARLRELAATAGAGRARLHGVRVAIFGAPNAGKSTLFNALLGADRALIHDEPGTTRDVLEAVGSLAGVPITWLDTAGVRETGQAVEAAGIAMGAQAVASADIVLVISDRSRPPAPLKLPSGPAHRQVIELLTKADLPPHPSQQTADMPAICSHRPEDVKQVSQLVADAAMALSQPAVTSDLVLTRARHADAMQKAATSLDAALNVLAMDGDLELAAADLRDAATTLAEVTGQIATDDVLDLVFSAFCIGK